jgi:hypothetical protein
MCLFASTVSCNRVLVPMEFFHQQGALTFAPLTSTIRPSGSMIASAMVRGLGMSSPTQARGAAAGSGPRRGTPGGGGTGSVPGSLAGAVSFARPSAHTNGWVCHTRYCPTEQHGERHSPRGWHQGWQLQPHKQTGWTPTGSCAHWRSCIAHRHLLSGEGAQRTWR